MMTKKVKEISCFELLDVLIGDLKASELRFSHQKMYNYFSNCKKTKKPRSRSGFKESGSHTLLVDTEFSEPNKRGSARS
jgi:hypothetical protein